VDQENWDRGESEKALATVLAEFAKLNTKLELPEGWIPTTRPVTEGAPRPFVVHLIGNHELYNFTREQLRDDLGTNGPPPSLTGYYSFSPHPQLRCVVLDAYDVNTIDDRGHDPASHEKGFAFLEQQNKSDLRGRGSVNWLEGLQGKQKRFNPFNGGLGEDQIKWLGEELQKADAAGERVVVMSHVPMCPLGAKDVCLLWNYQEVLDVLHAHPCVVACFYGHDHEGGYRVDDAGIHHVTFQSPLNSVASGPEPRRAHATVSMYSDRLELDGAGIVRSRVLPFSRRDDDPDLQPMNHRNSAGSAALTNGSGGGSGGGGSSRRRHGHGHGHGHGQLEPLVSVCPKGHRLELSTDTLPADSIHGRYRDGWYCDNCRAEGEPTDVRWVHDRTL
jgi:manganese-dependent ADP-ribose/CDP-alcohol diphosphatase